MKCLKTSLANLQWLLLAVKKLQDEDYSLLKLPYATVKQVLVKESLSIYPLLIFYLYSTYPLLILYNYSMFSLLIGLDESICLFE